MAEHTALRFFGPGFGAVNVRFAFGAMDQMAFAFEHADDREDAVVVALAGQGFLNLFGGRLTPIPDYAHDLQFFISECL
jgi:hypothetical protein